MNRTPVTSSQIKSIGFDPETGTLEIEFASGSGGIYQYRNVTPETFEALKIAPSVGSFFIHTIKKHPEKYPYQKIS